jgi:RHS repeat-associated protein
VLSDGTANYVYGHDRLRAQGGPWYIGDALGSVRQTLDDAGGVLGSVQYDPWGVPTAGTPQPFGFTGELHHQGQVYLRARWYAPGQGRFVSEDPFAGWATRPYSLHAYQYAYSNPVRWTDPSGRCIAWGENSNFCDTITTWERFEDVFPYFDYRHNPYGDTPAEIGQYYGISPREAAEWAAGYWIFIENPIPYWSNPRTRGDHDVTAYAEAFSQYFLGIALYQLMNSNPILLEEERDYLFALDDCEWQEWGAYRYVEIVGLLGLMAGGSDTGVGRNRKGPYTRPLMPSRIIVQERGVTVQHYYRGGDHAPPHLHVDGRGPSTRIGQNGKPLDGDPELTTIQKQVIQNNLPKIRKAVRKISRYHWYEMQ